MAFDVVEIISELIKRSNLTGAPLRARQLYMAKVAARVEDGRRSSYTTAMARTIRSAPDRVGRSRIVPSK